MEQSIHDFLNCKRIAVVGFSRRGSKFGNYVYNELQKKGYEVYAVHSTEQIISGVKCYSSLSSLKDRVDGVFVCVPPESALEVLKESAENNLKNVWLQQGAESEEVLNIAKDLNLNLVSKKCLLMYAQPVRSFHKLHRGIVKIFGKL
jgi:uncharacterized protein